MFSADKWWRWRRRRLWRSSWPTSLCSTTSPTTSCPRVTKNILPLKNLFLKTSFLTYKHIYMIFLVLLDFWLSFLVIFLFTLMNRPGSLIDNITKNIKFNSVCAISWNNYKLCSRACSPELVLILCSEFILTFPIYSCTLSFLWVFMMIRGFEDVLFSCVHWLTLPEFPKSSCLFLIFWIAWW